MATGWSNSNNGIGNGSGNGGNGGHGGNGGNGGNFGEYADITMGNLNANPRGESQQRSEKRNSSATRPLLYHAQDKLPEHIVPNISSIFAQDPNGAADEIDMKDSSAVAVNKSNHGSNGLYLMRPSIQDKISTMLTSAYVRQIQGQNQRRAKNQLQNDPKDLYWTRVPVKDEFDVPGRNVRTALINARKWFATITCQVMIQCGLTWMPWNAAVDPFLRTCVSAHDRSDSKLNWCAWSQSMQGLIKGAKDGLVLLLNADDRRILKSCNMSEADCRYINFVTDRFLFKNLMQVHQIASQFLAPDGSSFGVFEVNLFKSVIEESCGLPAGYISDPYFYSKLLGTYPNVAILDIVVQSAGSSGSSSNSNNSNSTSSASSASSASSSSGTETKRVIVGLGRRTPLQYYCGVSLNRDIFTPLDEVTECLQRSFASLVENYVKLNGYSLISVSTQFMESLYDLSACNGCLRRKAWVADLKLKGYYVKCLTLSEDTNDLLDLTDLNGYGSLSCVGDVFLKLKGEKERELAEQLEKMTDERRINAKVAKKMKDEAKREVKKWDSLYWRHRIVVFERTNKLVGVGFVPGSYQPTPDDITRISASIIEALVEEKHRYAARSGMNNDEEIGDIGDIGEMVDDDDDELF